MLQRIADGQICLTVPDKKIICGKPTDIYDHNFRQRTDMPIHRHGGGERLRKGCGFADMDCELFIAELKLLNIAPCESVLHGSCVQMFGKGIAIIGKKNSGKSTLTKYFVDYCGASYLTDDCIYIINNSYYGFAMPIPMRTIIYQNEKPAICMSLDSEGEKRYLYDIDNTIEKLVGIDYILFPTYQRSQQTIQTNQLYGTELVNAFLNNIRHMKDMNTLFRDVKNTIKNASAFTLVYAECADVYDWIASNIMVRR